MRNQNNHLIECKTRKRKKKVFFGEFYRTWAEFKNTVTQNHHCFFRFNQIKRIQKVDISRTNRIFRN